MKTYFFDMINRYRRFSEELDVKTVICNKSWWVFNDSDEKELYIFNPDGKLDVIYSGRVTEGAWRYVSANKSIIVSANGESFMLDPAFVDNAIFALKLNGTDQYVFMIDENNTASFAPTTYKELMWYFDDKRNKALALEEKKIREKEERELEERKLLEREKLERKKKEKEQQELRKSFYDVQKLIRDNLPRNVYEKYKLNYKIINRMQIFVSIVLFFGAVAFILFFVQWASNAHIHPLAGFAVPALVGVLYVFLLFVMPCCLHYKDKCHDYLKEKKCDVRVYMWDKSFDLYEKNVDMEDILKGRYDKYLE